MTLYEKLDTLTAGEIRGNLERFTFIYGEKAVETLGLEKIKDFSFWDNGRSVIIYQALRQFLIVIMIFLWIKKDSQLVIIKTVCFLNLIINI